MIVSVPLERKKATARKVVTPPTDYLWVVLNLNLVHGQIKQFRETMLHCIAGKEDNLVASNKKMDDKGNAVYRSAHPLLQFRCHHRHAAIFAMGRAVPVLEFFLEHYCHPGRKGRLFPWQGRSLELGMPLEREKENNFSIKLVNPKFLLRPLVYRLYTWLPVNDSPKINKNTLSPLSYKSSNSEDSNYDWWKRNRDKPDTTKTKKLEEILVSHLAAVITATGGNIPKQKIKLTILDKDRLKKVNFKDIGQVAFDIRYTVNLQLPQYIGLGNHPAFGFGWQRLETDNVSH